MSTQNTTEQRPVDRSSHQSLWQRCRRSLIPQMLTPECPQFFLPIDPSGAAPFVEGHRRDAVQSFLMGLFMAIIGAPIVATSAADVHADPRSFNWVALLTSLVFLGAAIALAWIGVRWSRTHRAITYLPDRDEVSLQFKSVRGRITREVNAPVDRCDLRIHQVDLHAGDRRWSGPAVIVHVPEGTVDHRVVLACLRLPEAANAYVRALPPWLRIAHRGDGQPIDGDTPAINTSSASGRLERGQCPRCGYDLLALDFRACPECGWDFSSPLPRPHTSRVADAVGRMLRSL